MPSDASPSRPATAGLAAESARAGLWLFRWRSYHPLPVLAVGVAAVALDPVPLGGAPALPLWVGAGMALGSLGLAVRGWTVGLVPGGTSGRGTERPRAAALNTTGVYSLVRHPLYLGNGLLWVGGMLVSGKPGVVLLTALLFWLVYRRIMLAEEHFLHGAFGAEFEAWARRTPAFVPRLSGWIPSPHGYSLRFALGRDYPALYAFVTSTTALALTRSVAVGDGWRLSTPWLAYFAAGSVAWLVLHALKRLTRALEVEDR